MSKYYDVSIDNFVENTDARGAKNIDIGKWRGIYEWHKNNKKVPFFRISGSFTSTIKFIRIATNMFGKARVLSFYK